MLENPVSKKLSPPSGSDAVGTFSDLIATLISSLIIVAAVIFFFYFLIGGIKWITSGGDKAKVEEARGTILNAVIGLIITFSLFAVLRLIETLFGVNILEIDLGPLRIGA